MTSGAGRPWGVLRRQGEEKRKGWYIVQAWRNILPRLCVPHPPNQSIATLHSDHLMLLAAGCFCLCQVRLILT